MYVRRFLGVTFAALALACVTSSAALAAHSSTLYPLSDSVSASSAPVTITTPELGSFSCTLNGGAFTIPSKGNASGPVTVNFTTRPTYTACTNSWTITTSGTWTLSAQYGEASGTVTIPASGIILSWEGKQWGANAETALKFVGGWNNGFASPVSVSSALSYGGAINLYWGLTNKLTSIPFTQALQTLTDTTHPSSLLLLGP